MFKELPLFLRFPVVVQLLHGITAVTEGGDLVSLDSQTYRTTLYSSQPNLSEKTAGKLKSHKRSTLLDSV